MKKKCTNFLQEWYQTDVYSNSIEESPSVSNVGLCLKAILIAVQLCHNKM